MASRGKKRAAETDLRFHIGSKVVCNLGADGWLPGTVVKLNYRESAWPQGRVVPYQVELADGELCCVPRDEDEFCKELVLPWWHEMFFDKPAGHFEEPSAVAELHEAGAGQNVNEADHQGRTALHRACRKGWSDGVDELIHMRADVNVTDNMKGHALHRAVFSPEPEAMVRKLCEARADPNCQDRNPDFNPDFSSKTFGDRTEHRTPLHYCTEDGDVATMCALIHFRADLDIQDGIMKTPLHIAIEEADVSAVDILLRSRADVNLGNRETGSPLMGACLAGDHDLASRLIHARANINQQGKQGMAAAHLASRRKDAQLLQILLQARADLMQESACGTALALAKKNGGQELLEMLGTDEAFKAQAQTPSVTSIAARRALLHMD